jgi:hypothetical protein
VHICHEALSPAAQAMAVASGAPDYEWLTVSYPFALDGYWTDEEVRLLAKQMAPRVVEMLTNPPERL